MPLRSLLFAESLQAQLLLLDPRQHTNKRNDGKHQHGPQLNMQHVYIGGGLSRRRNGREAEHQQYIPAHAMILPNRLGVVNTAIHGREEILRDAHYRLDGEHDVGDEPEDGVRRLEVTMRGLDFVVFDDDQPGEEGEDGGAVENSVNICALAFLFR